MLNRELSVRGNNLCQSRNGGVIAYDRSECQSGLDNALTFKDFNGSDWKTERETDEIPFYRSVIWL